MDSNSWFWEDNNTLLENITNVSNIGNELTSTCESITNHWLFFIFTGYLFPLLSPKFRDYCRQLLNTLKHNEISGKVVTLTEFGFEKIQSIEKNNEMKEFIIRMCEKKQISWDHISIEKMAWLFSGEKNDTHESIQQTWKRLNNYLDRMKIP